MSRLTIQQTAAPDFSGVAELMQGANRSFQDGIESAKGILGKYNEGQQAKGDQVLIGALAGLSSEEELSNFLKTTDLSSMNISDTMRNNILGARATILGNNATRQSTTNAADSNSRANAGEGRVAAEYADGVAARDELRGMTPAYVSALQEGQRYGYGATPNEREMLAATLQAEAGGEGTEGMLAAGAVIRNRAETGKYGGNTISGVIMQPGQFSAWNGVTGYAGGEGAIDMGNLRVSQDAYAAADAILSGDYQDPTGGATHYYNPAVANPAWGKGQNPGGDQWTTIGNHVFGNPDGVRASASGPVQGYIPGQITSNPAAGPGMTDFTTALQAGTHMTPDEAAKLYTNVLGQQAAGQTLIDQTESKRQDQLSASAQINAVLSPNNLTQPDVQRDLADTAGLDATHRLGLLGGDYSQYSGVIAPPVTQSADVVAAAQIRTDQIGRDQALAADNQPFIAAQQFDNSTDTSPGTTISASLPGAASNPVLAPASIDNAVSAFAKANGITNGEAAVVFQNVGQGNPELMQKLVSAVSAESEVNDNWMDTSQSPEVLSLNNMADRLFSQSARDAFDSRRVESVAAADLVKQNQSEILLARTAAAKLPPGSPERSQAEAEVRKREIVDMALNQPQQTKQRLADYLQVDPSELAIMTTSEKNAMAAQIEGDKNLSAEEKLLLIAATRI